MSLFLLRKLSTCSDKLIIEPSDFEARFNDDDLNRATFSSRYNTKKNEIEFMFIHFSEAFEKKFRDTQYEANGHDRTVFFPELFDKIIDFAIVTLSKHVQSGVMHMQITHDERTYVIYVGPNAYLVDTKWPYGYFAKGVLKDEEFHDLEWLRKDFLYLTKEVKKYYDEISKVMQMNADVYLSPPNS